MLSHAQPVVEGLKRKLQIGRRFEFDYGQTPCMIDTEQVDDAALSSVKYRDLAVNGHTAERGIDRLRMRSYLRFEPAFRVEGIERVLPVGGIRMAHARDLGRHRHYCFDAVAFSLRDSAGEIASPGAREFDAADMEANL